MRIVRSVRSALLTMVIMMISAGAFAQIGIGISVGFAPPALPVYEQPICPGDGYMWTPGYWAYGPDGYYWVPGTWVIAPRVGFLWTPPWWGWSGGAFLFHGGYWGPHVGFYGGISYGFGYFGLGFEGGRWYGGHFFYNRSVSNVNITNIHNTYNTTVVNNTTINHVSYNGGEGGITRQPTQEEQQYDREQHVAPVAAQTQHEEAARSNPQLRASVNHGKPSIAATSKPGDFHSATPAREAGGTYRPPSEANRGAETANRGEAERPENNVPKPPNASHASELQPHTAAQVPSTGNAKQDQKYQQQQQKLADKQNQEHAKLAQKQQQEDQRMATQKASDAQRQQIEQRHQQQTQQLEQRHTQQQQSLQGRQQPRGGGGGKR